MANMLMYLSCRWRVIKMVIGEIIGERRHVFGDRNKRVVASALALLAHLLAAITEEVTGLMRGNVHVFIALAEKIGVCNIVIYHGRAGQPAAAKWRGV